MTDLRTRNPGRLSDAMPILSIDDEPDSISNLVWSIRDKGLTVESCRDIDVAIGPIRAVRFQLLIIDAQIPIAGILDLDAGPTFVRQLKAGVYGELNQETPFVVVTSFEHEIVVHDLKDLSGYRGVVSKQYAESKVAGILDLDFSNERLGDENEFVVEDLLIVPQPPSSEGTVYLEVPCWPDGGGTALGVGELPADISEELLHTDYPFFVWAEVNVAARTSSELSPRNFRLPQATTETLRAFDELSGGGPFGNSVGS